jgi:hypothetical protein
MLGAVLEAAVTKHLQIDQAETDDPAPKDKDARQQVEPKVRAIAGCTGGHGNIPQTNTAAG